MLLHYGHAMDISGCEEPVSTISALVVYFKSDDLPASS